MVKNKHENCKCIHCMYAANTSILEILTLLIYNIVLISGAASSSLVGMLETTYTLKRTY